MYSANRLSATRNMYYVYTPDYASFTLVDKETGAEGPHLRTHACLPASLMVIQLDL